MNLAVKFLHSLSRILSAIGLYGEDHPARRQALDEIKESLDQLQDENDNPAFTFFNGEVVYANQPLQEMHGWVLSGRLAGSGIERIEFSEGVNHEEIDKFMVELSEYISGNRDLNKNEPGEYHHIRFGSASLLDRASPTYTLFHLYEQAEAADGLFEEADRKGRISAGLSRSVLDSIWGAMHKEDGLVIPIVPVTEGNELASVRSMNTSVLGIALGEHMKLKEHEIRMIGEAALLHDIGKVSIPEDILNKPGKLTDNEWEVVKRHPVEGSRILMRSGERFDMAAVAAYEHHLTLDGEGYPGMVFKRTPHRISQVVRLCDVYDAMRTDRPYEPPQPLGRIMEVMNQGIGTKFSPDLVAGFIAMLREWDSKFVVADTEAA